ncbi:MAG: hypothetical protein ACJARD_000588 [Alphaproteobacteria bacterium]|jgi:hypothetical protein
MLDAMKNFGNELKKDFKEEITPNHLLLHRFVIEPAMEGMTQIMQAGINVALGLPSEGHSLLERFEDIIGLKFHVDKPDAQIDITQKHFSPKEPIRPEDADILTKKYDASPQEMPSINVESPKVKIDLSANERPAIDNPVASSSGMKI